MRAHWTVWIAALWALAACQPDPLDTQGRIVCGTDGGVVCPSDFVCRFGRCCPSESTTATCPTAVTVDNAGSLACDNGTCPMNGECHFGRCCPAGSSAMVCPSPSMIDPHGAVTCEMGVCPGDMACHFGRCCPANSSSADCPLGLPSDNTGATYACEANERCPTGSSCRFGRCCPSDESQGTMACAAHTLGNPCRMHAECVNPPGTTQFCITVELASTGVQFPNGYCAATGCDTANPMTSCGPGGYCASYGVCLRTCTLPAGTTLGPCTRNGGVPDSYSCFNAGSPGDPTLGVCLPDCVKDPSECVAPARCNAATHGCDIPCDPTHGVTCPATFHCSNVGGPGTCIR